MRLKLILLFLLTLQAAFSAEKALTLALDCGRFGDQVINYIKALWISSNNELPLQYKPFLFSDQLFLSKVHPPLENFSRTFFIADEGHSFDEEGLYVISYYTPIEEWEDETFRRKLQELIRPIKQTRALRIPKGRISVAMHIRKGGGYDQCQKEAPLKFPPDTYYLSGLKALAEHFGGQPLYVHIFTDERKPKWILDKFRSEVKTWGHNIRIEGRTKKNGHDKNILEDFFAMTQFDCMIRPDSSYSRAAGAISGPIVEIVPQGAVIDKDGSEDPIIDLLIKFRPKKGENLTHTLVLVDRKRDFFEKGLVDKGN